MEALKGLLTPRQGRKIRFRAMTESYDLIDSVAERVDTQLIEHGDGVSVRDREPVTLYKLLDHDSMPTSDCSIIVETGLFRKPESRGPGGCCRRRCTSGWATPRGRCRTSSPG